MVTAAVKQRAGPVAEAEAEETRLAGPVEAEAKRLNQTEITETRERRTEEGKLELILHTFVPLMTDVR